jgi:hypothetical protein
MPILIEAEFNGEPRKLVLQATRNGFSSPWTVLRVSITKPETPLGGVRAAATNFSRK